MTRSGDPSGAHPPGAALLGLNQRALLCAWAFASTALYAASFLIYGKQSWFAGHAIAIALAAAASWVVLGMALLLLPRRYGTVGAWFDLCLRTIAWGYAVILGGSWALHAVTLAARGPVPWGRVHTAHAVVLGVSGLLMTMLFLRGSRRIGCPLWIALTLWIVALQGTFVLVFRELALIGDMWNLDVFRMR